MVEWLTKAIDTGLNIQPVGRDLENQRDCDVLQDEKMRNRYKAVEELSSLKAEQRLQWARFDKLKKGGPLEDIMEWFENDTTTLTARDVNGLCVVHVAAAYDRIDVLSRLVESKDVSLAEKDASGRTVLQVAVASNASAAIEWILKRLNTEKIAAFVSSHFRRRRVMQRRGVMLRMILTIQAHQRGSIARRTYRAQLIC
jgi:ankyrin repeat protein